MGGERSVFTPDLSALTDETTMQGLLFGAVSNSHTAAVHAVVTLVLRSFSPDGVDTGRSGHWTEWTLDGVDTGRSGQLDRRCRPVAGDGLPGPDSVLTRSNE